MSVKAIDGQFQINTRNSSYIMLVERGYLFHVYWGKKISFGDNSYMNREYDWYSSFSPNLEDGDCGFSLEGRPLEYSGWGRGDFKNPSIEIINPDGSNIVDLKYDSYEIIPGKPELSGLPSSYCEAGDNAETLKITLKDEVSNIFVHLYYAVFEDFDVITRWTVVENRSGGTVEIARVMSATVDFDNMRYDVISNFGSWSRERHLERGPVRHGIFETGSRRGASSHTHNPFILLCSHDACETSGDVYGLTLVYSGSYKSIVEGTRYHFTRLNIGINPDGFGWRLSQGETFTSPEVLLSYSSEGINKLSSQYHKMIRKRLCRGKYRDIRRPVIINSWEACYFSFDENKLAEIGDCAAKLGVELLVVDDGWFGRRDGDTSSLGDWKVDRNKLPNGIEGLYKRLEKSGCKLGMWFEPEMISPESELYDKHPDWCVHVEGRPRSLARTQLVLDLSRKDVCDFVYDSVANILKTGMVSYIKWDYNRNICEASSSALPAENAKEFLHRYYLGLYSVLDRLTKDFPDVLFENCSGGGGRFDCGMLAYMPQTWTSDDSDAVERLKIQYGTSIIYPLSTIVGHVSACPNHQTKHVTSFESRLNVALTGSFGYELDPTRLTEEEKEKVRYGAELYKKYGDMLVNGEYYRLRSPFEENCSAWCTVSERRDIAIAVYMRIRMEIEPNPERLILRGLDETAEYKEINSGKIYSGSQLMGFGIPVPGPAAMGEYASKMWIFEKI
ncbi:MAG: alpha-galactosidase [Clostridiales bacterium]|nr:alpha-galactosidase [Clostridiales bacterium]